MRVVVANKFWYPRGGLERVMFQEIEMLQDRGIVFAHFSTTHPSNLDSQWSPYFADYLELGGAGGLSVMGKARAASRMFYSSHARQRFARLLDDFRPDLIHAHGIHRQLSPSILLEAHDRNIPVIESLHDFHHLCPADLLLAGDGSVCVPPRCAHPNYTPAVRLKCVRHSSAMSGLSAAELWFQRVRKVYERTVRRFISPSAYLADTMRAGGWRLPIDIVPNPTRLVGAGDSSSRRSYGLVASRLSPEKGVRDALEAARRAGIPMMVAGEGPLSDELRADFPEVEFVGRVSPEQVCSLITGALATFVVSRCVENAPLTILESMAAGTPVIATRVGGIPEMIDDGVDGILVNPGDVDAIADALEGLAGDPDLWGRIAGAARSRVVRSNAPTVHGDLLMSSYAKAVAN